jgi:antitoxin (DNA-binding transcriptional repressor) of toxin-antitoxin stability system
MRPYLAPMTTLTVTQARKNLSGWLRRARAGEEIGIIDGNQIIALRPVTVTAIDFEEIPVNGTTQKKMDAIATAWKQAKK